MSDTPLVKRRSATLTIYQGDYPLRLETLARQVDAARAEAVSLAERADEGPPRRIGTLPKSTKAVRDAEDQVMRLAQELDALVEEATDDTAVTLHLEALPRRQWRNLKREHPPREGNEGDDRRGVNWDTMCDDAAPFTGCVVDPKFTVEEWVKFADDLGDSDWRNFCELVWEINERSTQIPKYSAVSLLQRQSEKDSASRKPSESAPADSTAGNRRNATTTTTMPETTPATPSSPSRRSGTTKRTQTPPPT